MPYIAHVGVQLSTEYTAYEKNHWYYIKEAHGLRYHWRINDCDVYEVVCELFSNKELALLGAKYIYVTVLYNLLYHEIGISYAGCNYYAKRLCIDKDKENYPEGTFFWTPTYIGGGFGPDVYEVPESFEDFDKLYKNLCSISKDTRILIQDTEPALDFDNYDKGYFMYNTMTQPFLYTIVQADSIFEIGLRMTLYCGLLEHMAEDKLKHPSVLSEIESLIEHVKSSSLSQEDKSSLVTYLQLGKSISAKQKCRLLCQKYAKDHYGPHTTKQILDDAYSIRSAFSHGEDCSQRYSGPAPYIKLIVLEVLIGYVNDYSNNS